MQVEGRLSEQATLIHEVVNSIERISRGKELFIAFDRDGTLVPYADRPEEAILNPTVHESLRALAIAPRVIAGIVSARSIALLRGEFDYHRLFLAGNYGLEIALPGENPTVNDMAASSTRSLKDARDKLASLARPEINAILEDHGYSLCVHWHTVAVEAREAVHQHVAAVSKQFPELKLRALPTSYEFLPDVSWDKGRALAAINELVPQDGERAYVFVGDSPPDEPAFAWVNAQGGVSVRIGSAGGNTCSKFQLADTTDVAKLISLLIQVESLKQ
jgi:trehalose 6-phosphate phosphatase